MFTLPRPSSVALFALLVLPAQAGARQGASAVPERRLDRAEARYATPFSLIAGIRELPDGRVLVSDPIEETLLRIDLATGQATQIGRVGQGPGEYKTPDRIFAQPDGSTLLSDLGNGRISVFGADGRYQESFPIVQGAVAPGAGQGRPMFILATQTDGQGRLYFQQMGGSGVDSAAVVRYDRRASRIDTVAFVKVAPPIERISGTATNRNVMMTPPIYPRQDSWAVAPDGRLAIVRAADYHVEWVSPAGRIRGQPVAVRLVAIGAGEKQEWMDRMGSGIGVSMENRNGEVTTSFTRGRPGRGGTDPGTLAWPGQKPPFVPNSAMVTPEGELWVERSVPAGTPRQYDTFNAQGSHTGKIIVPARTQVIGFGRGTAYAVRLDADELQYLERFRR